MLKNILDSENDNWTKETTLRCENSRTHKAHWHKQDTPWTGKPISPKHNDMVPEQGNSQQKNGDKKEGDRTDSINDEKA